MLLDTLRLRAPRFPVLRMALIAALCGAAVGLLQFRERRATSPLLPALATPDRAVLTVDMRYRMALFAYDLAVRCGVPTVARPTAWEEGAVARYEQLALRPNYDALACHRLGVIYARRGYLRQAREMLMRAAAADDEGGKVYGALLLVYSDDTIAPEQIDRLRQAIMGQPSWLAMLTMADFARRVKLEVPADSFESRAQQEIRRFGWRVVGIWLVGLMVVGVAGVVLLVAGLRALFERGRVSPIWPPILPLFPWVQILDVPALVLFCNALGQMARDSLASAVAQNSSLDIGLRTVHALLVLGPPLYLVITRAKLSPWGWRRAVSLQSRGFRRHAMEALVGLGVTLVGALTLQDLLLASLRTALPGVMPGAVAEGGVVASGSSGLSFGATVLLVVFVAPICEEIIFRGFVFQSLLLRMRPLAAASLSALLFAGTHLVWDAAAFLSLFVLGFVSANVYRSSQSLLPSILLHSGYNVLVLLVVEVLRM
ncbi:MAG: CPBP family glutamic-type intramembrane protease [Candidatus Zipacnadales bacterium]